MKKLRQIWPSSGAASACKVCPSTGRNASTALGAAVCSEERLEHQGKPFEEIPGPKGLPYLGTLLQYRLGPYKKEAFHNVLVERYRQYGPIFKETITGHTTVHLFDPDFVKVVYQQEGKIPHIHPLMETVQQYRQVRQMSLGLGNCNGEEWYHLRSAVQQMMMRPKAVSRFLPQVNHVVDDFVTRISRIRDPGTGSVEDFANEILKWNLESSSLTCFETRVGAIEAGRDSFYQKMIDANSLLFELTLKLKFAVPWYKFFSTLSWKKLLVAEDLFFGFGQQLVDETVGKIKALVESGRLEDGQYGFLAYLLGKPELTHKDISIITLSLFSDGLSTTSPSMIGQLFCLASSPDKQQRLYEEISTVAPNRTAPITTEMINSMSYLRACLKEGFRLFPIGTDVSRIPQKDLVLGGYQIPAGTCLSLNNNLLLRMPEYFTDPERYIPERWERGGSGHTIHPFLLLPFSFGPRTCAGKRFAEQEMQVLIIKLLQNFRLEWPHDQTMGQTYNMLLTPDLQPNFRFVPRS